MIENGSIFILGKILFVFVCFQFVLNGLVRIL